MTTRTYDGLKLTISGTKLIDMSKRSIAYHSEKVTEFTKKIDELRKITQSTREELVGQGFEGKMSNSYGQRDPMNDLQSALLLHEGRVRLHKFFVENIDAEGTFILSSKDLADWGISSNLY